MRKAIFLNFPTHGCINSLLATAKELVDRGEKIIYYCSDEFRDKIDQTGAEFIAYKGLINNFHIDNFDLFKALKLNIEMTIDKLDHHIDLIRDEKPDYIIHDSLCTWGKLTAAILKVPAVNLMHSFPITRSSITFNFDTAVLLSKVGLYKLFGTLKINYPPRIVKQKYDIDLSLDDIFINKEKLNIVYTSKYMEPNIYHRSKSYKFVGPSLFFKNEQNDFPYHRLKGNTVIYISLGTLLSNNLSFYEKCIKAFSNEKVIVIMSIGFEIDINALGELPDNFIVRQSVPQQKLLEHVDIFITHAGMNSVNEAICLGVPMIMLPHTIEQKMISKRITELGLGITMNINHITPSKLNENVKKLMTDTNLKNQSIKFKSVFGEEEKVSHIKAVDEILSYIDQQYQY